MAIMDFLFEQSILLYFLIFFGKLVEVSFTTIRIVLINRGERTKGTLFAFFESCLWLLITGTVLVGLQQDPLRCLVFAVAFALGNYLGSWIEEKLAFGLSSIQVITSNEAETESLLEKLRENAFAVTTFCGEGKEGKRELLILHLKRNRIPQAIEIINNCLDNALIIVNDTKIIRGGFIKK